MKHLYPQDPAQEEHPIPDEPLADETGSQATSEDPKEEDAGEEDAGEGDAGEGDDATESAPAEHQAELVRRPARSARGGPLFGAGLLVAAAGVVLGALGQTSLPLAPEQITRLGLSPFGLLSTGILLVAASVVLRRLAQATATMRTVKTRQKRIGKRLRAISEDVAHVHENMLVQMDRPPASGEELNRVLQALKKQEEKLQGLAKTSMTYAKPIAELGAQYKELTERANGLQEGMEDVSQKVRATGDRMETRSREVLTKVDDSLQIVGGELQQAISRQFESLGKALEARDHGKAELEELLRQSQAVQETVQTLGRELPQSVARQVEGLGKTLEARGDGTAELDKLARQIEGLGKTMESRGSGTADLDKLLRQSQAVQESVATLAQQIAQGVSVAAGHGAAGGGSPGGGTAGSPTPAVSEAPARAAVAASAEPAKTGDVHGAIAKLKKLRGR